MDGAIEQLQAKDTKEKLIAIEKVHALLEQNRKSVPASEVGHLVDVTIGLLKDNNFRVCQGALQVLTIVVPVAGDNLKVHLNALLPAVVERLGDGKPPVRDAARRLLLTLMEVTSPATIVDRAGNYAWSHKNWRVREEFARMVTSAINLFSTTELSFQCLLLPSVLHLLEDSNNNVREAAMLTLEEMYRRSGSQVKEELHRHSLRPAQLKEITARFEKIEPKLRTFENLSNRILASDTKQHTTGVTRKTSPKAKSPPMDASSGESEGMEKPVDVIQVSSEKELAKEIEKVSTMLTPEEDWSVRMAAMQRLEGLVFGGAADYASFPSLLKQLVGPLSVQLSDRRSSIVKQACHLLNLLSKELLGDFESCAEALIPALFKSVVITVLVIAESADNCIKTLLRHCRVARVLPRIVDCAKNDRSAVLRARCCEYALLVLEQWSESPEIQRSAELYEDLIKCCVGDAMSEVRSMARSCYRVFAKIWPDRARRVFSGFDPVIQRLINEEDGGLHKRYASPAVRERNGQSRSSTNVVSSTGPQLSGAGGNFHLTLDRLQGSVNVGGGQRKCNDRTAGRTMESALNAGQQQVTAIEKLLKGMEVNDKGVASTATRIIGKDPGGSYRKIHAPAVGTRVGIDPPSARDPPYPASAPAPDPANSHAQMMSGSTFSLHSLPGRVPGSIENENSVNGAALHASTHMDAGRIHNGFNRDIGGTAFTSNFAKRVPMVVEKLNQAPHMDGNEVKGAKRVLKTEHIERVQQSENLFNFGFPRPPLRAARSASSSKSASEETQPPYGEAFAFMDGLMSLNDALIEGLSPNADWSARVGAFTFLGKVLQQGQKGVQEVNQNFERVMKLFYQHLDDPHHKVAQAALSTLAKLVQICKKSFESYLERILPRVFARLVDSKEVIRQLSTSTLEVIGNTYAIDSLLPALLRSLDEQRSPKAKMAVIEFAIAAFAKLALSGEAGSGLLKLWLAKLAPLANDKNTKLKETAITGIISVYSHFDATTVLNFILGLSIEEQSILRRALKQYTPRIEVDLMTYVQNKGNRSRSKTAGEHGENAVPSEESYGNHQENELPFGIGGGYSSGSVNFETNRKWGSSHQEMEGYANRLNCNLSSIDSSKNYFSSSGDPIGYGIDGDLNRSRQRLAQFDDTHSQMKQEEDKPVNATDHVQYGCESRYEEKSSRREADAKLTPLESASSIMVLLHKMSNRNDGKMGDGMYDALTELLQSSQENDSSIWCQYHKQILTVVLDAFDEPDPAIRESACKVIAEMLSRQKTFLEGRLEVVLEKLLHAATDPSFKVVNAADHSLTSVLSNCDPYRCLEVVVPLLVNENEKLLVTCINSLTKLVPRLPQEDLMAQLPLFLPALFDAFGNQNADVRKTVVFCLVDIYIVLGKAFVPYLGSLSSTQLRLVTIYANRISQARTGASID